MKFQKPPIKKVLLGIALFLFLIVWNFPYQNLRGKLFAYIQQNSGVVISSEDMALSFLGWPGIKLTNVDVNLPLGTSGIDIHSEKVVFRIGLGGLFPPQASISLKIQSLKKGGDIYTSIAQPSGRVKAYVDVEEVELSQINFSSLSSPIEGVLTMTLDMVADQNDLAKSTGYLKIEGTKLKTPTVLIPMSADYGFTIPSLTLGTLKGNIQVKNGSVEITTMQFGSKDTDLEGSLSGDIRLGQTWQASFLNLKLRLKISDACKNNPQSATLVSFLNPFANAKGDGYGMKCSASIQDITTRFACAIPEKLTD